jgi:F-type H+-transporting ATPase subunit gamma
MNSKNVRQLDMEIELTRSIQLLAKTYEELAVMQMQRIRKSVENTRKYTDDLNKIYSEVKFSYRKKLLTTKKGKADSLSLTTFNKNGKKLALLITPDHRFTGNIAKKVFYPFYEYINTENCDVAVIGKVGKEMFDQTGFSHSFVYINIPETSDYEALDKIFDYMLKYESIEVFHGKFMNLINQIAVKQNLTGDELESNDYDAVRSEEYLFEPTAEKILNFFEEQIFGTLFKQILSEASLARLGSRISAMETATNNAGLSVKMLNRNKNAFMKAMDNKKQLQRISGISIWG